MQVEALRRNRQPFWKIARETGLSRAPRTNGKAERFVPTSLREWAYAKPSNHSSERAAALLPFLHNYNHHRPHFGINGRPPISRISVNNLSRRDS
jgi:transposase InsO family protein